VARLIEWESVKEKLRLNDDTLKEEMYLYIQEVDDLVNNRLRNKLGTVDFNGIDIILPLTVDSEPAIDEELKAIATDLVIGKFRLQTSEKPLVWDTAIKNLDNYLDRRFGYTRDVPFRQIPILIPDTLVGPPSTVVTIEGQRWKPNSLLKIFVDGIQVITFPVPTIVNVNGQFSGVTFTIPRTSPINDVVEINVTDGKNAKQVSFSVIPFVKSFTIDGRLL